MRTESALLTYLQDFEHLVFYKSGIIEIYKYNLRENIYIQAFTDYMQCMTWLQERSRQK